MLGELLTRNAQNNPDKTALKAGTLEVTYRELEMHSQAVAQALLELGLQPGDRVALHLLNGIETAVSYFACFRAGLIAVPCNLQLKAEEIAFALENSQARTYVVTQTLSDLIQAVRLRLPAVERIVQVDQKPGENESIDESYDFGGLPMSRDRKSL
ncbi:MAG: acyl--CoA ligase, partial [Blastocatellia bacterium]|nr:acyl--CoA ligase [Blastocatellia bacterium]